MYWNWKALFHRKIESTFFHLNPEILAKLFKLSPNPNRKQQEVCTDEYSAMLLFSVKYFFDEIVTSILILCDLILHVVYGVVGCRFKKTVARVIWKRTKRSRSGALFLHARCNEQVFFPKSWKKIWRGSVSSFSRKTHP